MELSNNLSSAIESTITIALEQQSSFPLQIKSERGITHTISKEKVPGYLISTMVVKDQTFLIYLTK